MSVQSENMGNLNCVDVCMSLRAVEGDCLILCPTEKGTTVSFIGETSEKKKQRPSPLAAPLLLSTEVLLLHLPITVFSMRG